MASWITSNSDQSRHTTLPARGQAPTRRDLGESVGHDLAQLGVGLELVHLVAASALVRLIAREPRLIRRRPLARRSRLGVHTASRQLLPTQASLRLARTSFWRTRNVRSSSFLRRIRGRELRVALVGVAAGACGPTLPIVYRPPRETGLIRPSPAGLRPDSDRTRRQATAATIESREASTAA